MLPELWRTGGSTPCEMIAKVPTRAALDVVHWGPRLATDLSRKPAFGPEPRRTAQPHKAHRGRLWCTPTGGSVGRGPLAAMTDVVARRAENSPAAASSLRLGSPCHICTGTGLTLPHLRRDWAYASPHLRRD